MKPINPYPLRIDEELMDKLRIIDEENSRSVNKEIEYLIKQEVQKYEEKNNNQSKEPINQ